MNSTAMQSDVEAPNPDLPPVVAGEIRPWKRGGLLGANGIAKFYPAESYATWTTGGTFRVVVPTRGLTYTVIVTRHLPARIVPAQGNTHRRGSRSKTEWTRARRMPECVVVQILSIETRR